MESFKLSIEGEFDNEETAIKELADSYMQASKCNPPGEHPAELMGLASFSKDLAKHGKQVLFSVWEKVYDREQWVEKNILVIHPFKKEHWWESEKGFEPQECEFKYEIKVEVDE
ncbi:MAG: hypothetical protein WC333_02380 [Dehalococcoidia bacterium]